MSNIKPISFFKFSALITLLVLLCTIDTFAQGRDRTKYQLLIDTNFISGIDSSVSVDTNRVREPVDSTARIKYFKYQREEKPVTTIKEDLHPLLLGRSFGVEYNLTFDSLSNAVITESFYGDQIKVPLVIPLEKYLEVRTALERRNQMYNILAEYYKIETEDDLTQLFRNITEITIPLPFTDETIFGPPTINLKINGVIDITASYQKTQSDLSTISTISNDQNNINFKQEVQVTTKGTVGDKLTIDADWNSQRTFDFENQLKLKYKGYPDEVVQGIEAGNVSLETRSNLIGGTQALFGVKAQFKLGPLSLTTIASQKKSEKKEVDITGGTVETPFDIPIWDYSENNYLLDETFKSDFESYYRTGQSTIDITKIEIWVYSEANNPKKRAVLGIDTVTARDPNGYIGQDTASHQIDGHVLLGNFYKLDPSEYTLNRYAGYFTLNGNLQQSGKDAICVAYTVKENGVETQYGDYVENVLSNKRLVLKLIRHSSQQSPDQKPAHARLWERMLKNIYHLGVRNIKNDASSLEFDIYYAPPGVPAEKNYTGTGPSNGKSYMNLTRLDYRRNGNPTDTTYGPDGQFDFFPNNTIDLTNGNIIFPIMRPFSTQLQNALVDTSYIGKNDTIYTSSKNTAQSFGNIKFYMRGKAKGDASSRYSLGFNVVEGSVKVFNGSNELGAGIDYNVDYTTGELVITNASALVAGANLKITYETNDLFQLASKTLLGTRAELQIGKSSYVGFTLINLKQQTLNDKIRIGEEPTNNTIMGFDASTDIKVNFLTKLLNKIPGYFTKDESILNLKGEVAFMLPDPNTKKSIIPGDNNESVAYIDDFEGVKKILPLGLNPLSWTLGSVPVDYNLFPIGSIDELKRDSLTNVYRSKLTWYSQLNGVQIKDVYPNRSIASNQNQTLTPLVFEVKPDTVGHYNLLTQNNFINLPSREKKWSGVFRYLNSSQTNLIDENINYIEIWMQVRNINASDSGYVGDSAKMYIDLGTVSERIITANSIFPPNSTDPTVNYHTEDKDGSGQLDENEDNGIDGYTSTEEKIRYDEHGLAYDNSGDPARDDFNWTQGSTNFSSFNGTEKNASQLTEAKKIDSEDLNNNGTLDLTNNYFEYEIPLNNLDPSTNPYIAGGGNLGWYQFVIPLDEWKRKIGENASFTSIQYVRVWYKGFSTNAVIRMVDFSLVGSQWVKQNKNDTNYSISVVNIEDNSNIYEPPVPGDILRQKDQTQPDQNILSNEQSISLDYSNVLPGQGKYIFKSYNIRPLDLINYKILKLFVNGDTSLSYTNKDVYDAAVVVRIGSDTANYYEYRAPIHPDTRPGTPWNSLNEVIINLTELAAIKQLKDSSGSIVYKDVPNGPPGSKYGVIGSPSIRDVRQIALGVYNNNSNPIIAPPISGSVWFNEMRVLKTNDASGYAFTLSAGLKLADLATINFSYTKTDPNFHNLEGRFGSLNLANSWDISTTFNFHKLLNALLAKYVSVKFKNFFTIPITYSHTEILDKPKYLPATDIDVETAAQNRYEEVLADNPGNTQLATYEADKIRINSQTLRIANRFSITGMKFNFPVDNFFAREILNKIEINFTRNNYTERSPTLESKYAWEMTGGIGMTSDIGLMNDVNLKIGKWLPFGEEFREARMYFFFPFIPIAPLFTNNLGLSANFNRNRGDEKLRTNFSNSPTTRNFDATRGFALDWKFIENWLINIKGNYSFRSGSDLTFLETTLDSSRTQRPEGEILDDIFFNGGIINWGRDLDYSQNVSILPEFRIPIIRDFVDLTSSYRVQYGWRKSEFNESYGSTVGYSSDFQTTAFVKLNEIINLFKPKSPSKLSTGSGSPLQDQQDPADILKLLGSFVPDQVTISFTQGKQLTNPGVGGRPGFGNFWMNFKTKDNYGPSRLYQLGWEEDPGQRVANLQFTDAHNLNNIWQFNTMITPIFRDNLKINFTYKTSYTSNKQLSYLSDSLGRIGEPNSTGENKTISRPSFFVSSDIIPKLDITTTDVSEQAKELSSLFEQNVVSFPFPSWTLNLTGVEKFDLFSGFASQVTIESGYTSEYRKTLTYDGRNPVLISNQVLTSGFTPLIGININFKPLSEGILTAAIKYSKGDNFNLDPNNARVTNTATADFSINASYSKSGFKIPLFGLALDNNLTVSFSYTSTKNEPTVYSYDLLNDIWNTNAQSGATTTTTINPSIQYSLSRSVTLQLFYKYSKTEPSKGNQLITTRTSNEAGLNIKLQIQ